MLVKSVPESVQKTHVLTIIYHAMGRQDESNAALEQPVCLYYFNFFLHISRSSPGAVENRTIFLAECISVL